MTSLPRKVLLPIGIWQHVFGCQLKDDSNRMSLHSNQLFSHFPSYLTTNDRKHCDRPSCNGCCRHSASYFSTSIIVRHSFSYAGRDIGRFSEPFPWRSELRHYHQWLGVSISFEDLLIAPLRLLHLVSAWWSYW